MSTVRTTPVDFDPFANGPILRTTPATESQLEIWTSVQFGDDANCAFNESIALKFTGKLDHKALSHAIEQLIARHDGLRTIFSPDGQTLIILAEPRFNLELHDLSYLTGEERLQHISQMESEAAQTPFDLERGPLFRSDLIKLQEDEYILLVTSHHIICDGWSIWVILEELGTLYTALSSNTFADLQNPFQFSSYAIEQNNRIESGAWREDEEFWLRTFTPPPPPLELPTTNQRPASRSFRAARKDYTLPSQLISPLKSFAVQQKTTLTVALLSAFSAFIYRLSHQDDTIIGVPAAGQSACGHHYLVGHCVNLLPMRCKILQSDTFSTFLERYKETMLDAFDHQQYTYGSLLQKLDIPRDAGRPPLVSILFNIDQGLGEVKYGDLEVEYYTPPRSYENFEIFLNASERKGELHIECQYNTDLFSDSTITLRLQEFEYFLEQLLTAPRQHLSLTPLIPRQEEQVLASWNNTTVDLPPLCIHNLVEHQVKLHPGNKAIIFADSAVTYQALNQQANMLARQLQAKGIARGSLVGLYFPRSIEMIIALLAVLKAGGAYVPLDPNYPEQRISYMVDNSAMSLVLTNDSLLQSLPDSKAGKLSLDSMALDEESVDNLADQVTPDDLAYVIYTSGSTGNPKGVQVHHRAVVNFLTSMAERPGIHADDTLLAVTTLSFDIAVLEILLPLTTGATVALADTDELSDGFLLQQLIDTTRATIMQATPATWHMLLASGWHGKPGLRILCGGEVLPAALAKKLLPRCSQLWNMFGPTETTVWSTCFQVQDAEQPILIGTPINNTTIYLLDDNLQPAPIGVPAELCIGGEGVSKGYLGRDDLTNQQFIANPIAGHHGEIIYKTGDLVRMREDGCLEYFNRLDNQVKIRGFRIELGEIETALESFPGVERAAVKVIEASLGDSRLAAFFTASEQLAFQDLRDHIRTRLPGYMIPQHIVQLQYLPLTPAGKIDRKSLPNPLDKATEAQPEENLSKPRNKTEEQLLDIWQKLLGHTDILLDDVFFNIGGHSLLATMALAKLSKIGFQVNLRQFFEFPTIQAMAQMLDSHTGTNDELAIITAHGFQETAVMSLQQQRLWYLDKLDDQATVYNLPAAFRMYGNLDIAQFEQSIQAIFDRHESLRTGIIDHGDSGRQYILKEYHFSLTRIDLSGENKVEQENQLLKIMTDETARPFVLSEQPLFKAILFTLSSTEHAFFFMPHHAIWDGWSFDIFLHELRINYETLTGIAHPPLTELPVQYADFAQWQQKWLRSEELENQLSYWNQHLKNDLAVIDLATDYPRPPYLTYNNGASESLWLPKDKTDQLTFLAQEEQSTLFMILLTAYALLLHHYAGGQKTILIGSPISGRNNQDATDLIGFFVNTLILKIQIDPSAPFNRLLATVRQTCLDAFRHQEIPFEKLLESLNPPRDTSRSPIFQVLFAYQDVRNRKRQIGDLQLEQINIARSGTQTDIDFWVRLADHGLDGGFEYNRDLFEPETIRQMISHYQNILDAVIEDPRQPVSHIFLLTEDERKQIATGHNNTSINFQNNLPLPCLVDSQASRSPRETALIFNDIVLSYKSLTEQANQWAHLLIAQGVRPGDIVGICMDRSEQMIICLLAILKTGAAYLPLDPHYPAERLAYMAGDSGVKLILTESHLQNPTQGIKADLLLTDQEDSNTFPPEAPSIAIDQEDLAYIIYTSGSTGKPKGVQVPHRALTNFLLSMRREPGISVKDRLLAVTTLSFDIAGLELFLPLISGATCILADRDTAMDGIQLANVLSESDVTIMQATPSTWRMLVTAGWQGSENLKILCGGEAFPVDLVSQLLERSGELWNMYGPTESTIWSTCYRITDAVSPVSIGRPIANTQTYVLNEYLQPAPPGVSGELYIGGTGVTKGYRNSPELTKRQFLHNPFCETDDECNIMYRTGDRVHLHKNGTLEYIERIDNQVKVRGYRIELGEIESVITSHPLVKQAVVITKEEQAGDVRLVAYVILTDNADLDVNTLKNHLRLSLPDYMVPQHFVSIATIPLTPAGKIDRRALAAQGIDNVASPAEHVPPATETEQKLYDIWCELLQLPQISIHDNFFDAGGHSLLAVTLFVQIENVFKLELPLATLFQSPSIHTLADVIDAERFQQSNRPGIDADEDKEEFVI